MRSLVPFLVVVLVACAHAEAEPHLAARQEEAALQVETATVERVALPSVLDLTGTLIATDQVRVSTEVGGEVVAVRFALVLAHGRSIALTLSAGNHRRSRQAGGDGILPPPRGIV